MYFVGCVADLAFVVDNSGSIRDSNPPGRDNWLLVINFLKTLVYLITVGPRGNHVGLVEFGRFELYSVVRLQQERIWIFMCSNYIETFESGK